MKSKTIKLFTLGLCAVSMTALLAGCSSDDTDSVADNNQSAYHYDVNRTYQDAKSHGHVYKLDFFENKAADDDDTTYYELGYYKDGELKQKELTNTDNFKEVIEPNCKVPYVQIDHNGRYWIHRPPYNMYNQPAVKGTVTDKE